MRTMKATDVGLAVLAGLFAMGLAGCSVQSAVAPSGSEAGDGQGVETQVVSIDQLDADEAAEIAEQESTSPAALEIVDSGWFAADNGMVDFALAVQNPNHTVEATDAVIEVIGKDDAGNLLFDETIETPGILPESTYYYSYVAGSTAVEPNNGDDEVVLPATVEFSISTPEDAWKATDETLAEVYTVQDNGAADTRFGAKEFTGTVTASESLDGAVQSRVDVVLLDGEGHIEGGYFKIVETSPGQSVDYDIYAVGAPDFASYAIYASPWPDEAQAA